MLSLVEDFYVLLYFIFGFIASNRTSTYFISSSNLPLGLFVNNYSSKIIDVGHKLLSRSVEPLSFPSNSGLFSLLLNCSSTSAINELGDGQQLT